MKLRSIQTNEEYQSSKLKYDFKAQAQVLKIHKKSMRLMKKQYLKSRNKNFKPNIMFSICFFKNIKHMRLCNST